MTVKKIMSTFFVILYVSCVLADKPGYRIDVTVHGYEDTIAVFAYQFGNRQFVIDTVKVHQPGRFTLQGKERLDRGIYMVVLPEKSFFEILVDDNQHFSIETNVESIVNSIKFTNSPDNTAFYQYMLFIREMGERIGPLREEMQNQSTAPARRDEIRRTLSEVDQIVKSEQNKIIEKFPDGLFGKILLAQQEPPLPPQQLLPDGTPDNEFMYRQYKANFWKNIDFSDDRLLRTPIFHAKLEQYFTRVILQMPDSIIQEADRIVEKSRANEEIFKYVVFYITNTFERSQIMGMDAVFVHMVENYYMTGDVFWVNEEQLHKISERAMALKPLLLGKTAPNITMFSPNGRTLDLHDVNAKFTVLYFWDSECGHCKRNTPKLKEFYSRMNNKGVEIFAVNTESDREKWLNYVNENNLPWIHVNDPFNRSGFRDKYDIWATPLIFLLDDQKRILAKKITVEQTEEIINHQMNIRR